MTNHTQEQLCLETTAGQLLAAVKIAAKVSNNRWKALPVLQHVLFSPSAEAAQAGEVVGTDLDTFVSAKLSGIKAAFIADPKKLVAALKGVSGDEIIMATRRQIPDGDRITFNCAGLTFVMDCPPAIQMPAPPALGDDAQTVSLPAQDFMQMLKTCAPCMSDDETRYNINGVYMHAKDRESQGLDRRFSMAATDGHRLAEVHTDYITPCADMIIQNTVVNVLVAMPKPTSAERIQMRTSADGVHVEFSGQGWCVKSKAVDGRFPDYTRTSGKVSSAPIGFSIKPAHTALKRISTPRDKTPIAIDPSAQTWRNGGASIPVTMDGNAEIPAVGVQARYMHDVLTTMSFYGTCASVWVASALDPIAFMPDVQPAWGRVKITQWPVRL